MQRSRARRLLNRPRPFWKDSVRKGPSTAIIGGGIIGTSIALRLAHAGLDVTLFEKGQVGREASWAAAGMLAPGGEIDERLELVESFIESRALYKSFVAELSEFTGLAIDYQECGAIELAYSPEEWESLLSRAATQAGFGIQSRPLSVEQVRAFSPHLETERLTGALFYPGDAVVAPRDLMNALRAACDKAGAEIRENSPVCDIRLDSSGAIVAGERYSSAVLAAGAWSGELRLEGAGPIPQAKPVRGHLLGFSLQPGACPTVVRHRHNYVLQRSNGFLIAGGSMECVGFERTIDQSIADRIFRDVTGFMPILADLDPVDVWTGFRPSSEKIQLGRWRQTPLFLAYGHYRNGILLAPLTARRVADEILSVTTARSAAG
jgi:glycine oxidase